MKAAALMALLLWQAAPANEPPVAQPGHLRYLRALTVPAGAGQACAVLDAQVFPHAEPALIDLRIFPRGAAQHEVAYAITMSQAVTEETEPARVLNLGSGSGSGEGGKIVFDLEMPQRAYSDVMLDLDPNATNFLATATVTGMDELGGQGRSTALGSFTLFDLSSQHLSRDTTLPLEESTFHYLHVVLSVSPAPGSAPVAGPAGAERGDGPAMVRGAQVPPSREEQILYTTVAETSSLETAGRVSRATFEIPARVPVERVEFVPASGFKGNFSRNVKVTATAEPLAKGAPKAGTAEGDPDNDERAPLAETVTGNILRVHATRPAAKFVPKNWAFRRFSAPTCNARRRLKSPSKTATTSRCQLPRCAWRCASANSASTLAPRGVRTSRSITAIPRCWVRCTTTSGSSSRRTNRWRRRSGRSN